MLRVSGDGAKSKGETIALSDNGRVLERHYGPQPGQLPLAEEAAQRPDDRRGLRALGGRREV